MMLMAGVSSLLCVLSIFSSVPGSDVRQSSSGSISSDKRVDDALLPTPCCLPYRFQAIIAMLPNFNDKNKAVTRMSRDWEQRIQTQEQISFSSGRDETVISRSVSDYKHMVQYDYTPGGTCHASALDYGMLEPCMPENASYLGRSYLGAYNETTPFDTWRFKRTNLNRNLEITIAVTANKCVPVSEHITGQIGTHTVDSLVLFTNVTEQVGDSFFDIPHVCFGVEQM